MDSLSLATERAAGTVAAQTAAELASAAATRGALAPEMFVPSETQVDSTAQV